MNTTGNLTITTPSDREIEIERTFDAPRQLVFDAHTKPELIRQWLLGPPGWTMPVCEVDLRVGGRYRYVWRKPGVPDMGMGGVYREIAAPERIVTTELFDEDWTGGEVVSTLVLTEVGGRTRLRNTVRYSSKAARDGALQSGMEQGLSVSYDRLAEIVTRG